MLHPTKDTCLGSKLASRSISGDNLTEGSDLMAPVHQGRSAKCGCLPPRGKLRSSLPKPLRVIMHRPCHDLDKMFRVNLIYLNSDAFYGIYRGMSVRISLSPNAGSRREPTPVSAMARMLDRLARLEASLIGTRLDIDRALDAELEQLRALRKDLLAVSQGQSAAAVPAGKIVEFLSPSGISTKVPAPAELAPHLEEASMDDLSDALAAVFRER